MKLFVDTANLEELEQCLKRGFPSGVTTNPSILSREQRRDFRLHINDMITLLQKYGRDIPLSVEVFTADPDEMLAQAEEFLGHFGHYPHLNIKVPVGWNELAVIAELRRRGIRVNCTCCMSYNQAIMAARAAMSAWLYDMQQVQFTRMPRRRSSAITASSFQPTGTLMFRFG